MSKPRRKYYFKDYTQRVELSKKIKKYLFENRATQTVFHYSVLCTFLKKTPHKKPIPYQKEVGYTTYFTKSLIKDDLRCQIEKCFLLLQDLGYLDSYDFERIKEQDSYLIHVSFTDENREFDELLKESIYYPVEGEKQELTDELRAKINSEYAIDYQKIVQAPEAPAMSDYKKFAEYLQKSLYNEWTSKYKKMTQMRTNIELVERVDDFDFFFDLQSHSDDLVQNDDFDEDRIVVVYGFSKKSKVKRNDKDISSRMNGYLRGAWNWTDKKTDKGHFIGHSLGGNLDANLFPQRADINRGHSERGIIYRKMEQYCADNEGTFCFSRPIYCDFSDRPFVLEYGVLKQDGTLWVESFDNV